MKVRIRRRIEESPASTPLSRMALGKGVCPECKVHQQSLAHLVVRALCTPWSQSPTSGACGPVVGHSPYGDWSARAARVARVARVASLRRGLPATRCCCANMSKHLKLDFPFHHHLLLLSFPLSPGSTPSLHRPIPRLRFCSRIASRRTASLSRRHLEVY